MKRLPVALSILLTFALLLALPAEAQRGQHHGHHDRAGMMARSDSMPGPMSGMMQGGMMQQGGMKNIPTQKNHQNQ